MTIVPVHRNYPEPTDQTTSETSSQITSVYALKQMVARLHKEQQNVNDLLSSLGFALRSFNNLNQFLELIPLIGCRVTDADGGALVLFKPNGQVRFQQLHCQEGRQCQDIRQALEVATRQFITETTLPAELQEISIQTASLDYQVSNYLGNDVQLFGASILVNNSERGRLYVFSHDPQYIWTPARQKLIRLVTDQTAVAIANDELATSLREKERLDRELEIGAEIQLQLLPPECPEIPGITLAARCQTANRVGGDYYDFIPSNYDQLNSKNKKQQPCRWSIVIGDVMGKGVPAGLIMTMTRGMLRAEVLNRHSPARVLQHLNQVMYADLESSHRFVTLFYSEYNPETRILSYSNAAHHPPMLWQAASKSIVQLDTLGMLVGLEVDPEYHEAQVKLNPGDTIIYYTDGFTDAANQNGDRYDDIKLSEAFKFACQNYQEPQKILDYLFAQVKQFVGEGNQNPDDMTLVVMRVKSSTGE
ncbi:MAG: PP2C family protein-serine/threonine phosphatase [Okeania sp. SIO2G4]|uniref:PP2C family protein-serine/threonine phosphatase n=1 Tax=unclassified Okeania TaxID=2634635 RepID=UPI0013BB3891|nr:MULTISPECIES: PP2C family protein-serine/threonine phosphatase [unclassified Okeania]NEP05601.1 PP2C family protein-serine/threonine phosphatase [Okeania sp. SIO4D6]NEP38712.1 PP2C family protein-serine/threonine phosphatase [Okeania sp. SIO2H7]NEP75485.1 PP2C family protein-serine/threonine phosphatase [Okeania sp. SIO2G5]NEP95239.1 PP2C family protein-serine/threonine phosphatase [Okeania sp. SIO2F5]NEQ93738.1 PP2C family protein-serine/threonine phosphatase [Okeania sp. SIO2G4]